jgi:hypothetical protein
MEINADAMRKFLTEGKMEVNTILGYNDDGEMVIEPVGMPGVRAVVKETLGWNDAGRRVITPKSFRAS